MSMSSRRGASAAAGTQSPARTRERRRIRVVPDSEHDPLTADGQVRHNRAAGVPGPDDRSSHRLSPLRRETR
jgi:hypothetical protein